MMRPPSTLPDERVVLELSGVSKRFVAGVPGCCAEVRALDAVDWRVRAGEVAVVEGGPGAGKTTLLLCVAGLLRLDGGRVRLRAGAAPASIGYVAGKLHGFSSRIREASLAVAPAPSVGPGIAGPSVQLLDLDDADGIVMRPVLASIAGRLAAHGVALVVATRQAEALGLDVDNVLTLRDGRVARSGSAASRRAIAPASRRRKPAGAARR
jgi:energy-coupling factor transporter ATP-binding protein EcfA2